MLVRMDLKRIIIREGVDSQVIYLRERDGRREFPIVIGTNEALAIDRRIKGFAVQRPLTHELMASILDTLDGELERIIISDLLDHIFYATLRIRHNGSVLEVDARPSDAIALGAGTDAPIFVKEHVLRAVCMPDDEEDAIDE